MLNNYLLFFKNLKMIKFKRSKKKKKKMSKSKFKKKFKKLSDQTNYDKSLEFNFL